ncbi:MAG: FkbM family methyltransferase [Pseudonocardiales bacterium]|nr:FkbM family methyltransferase [Pseudonocardiales bacterium]
MTEVLQPVSTSARETLESHSQNGEDVVLARAFGSLPTGTYIDVGANEPEHFSITYLFYRLGWSGVTIDPVHKFVAAHRQLRPRDTQVLAAITDADTDTVTLFDIPDTGLSTTLEDVANRHEVNGFLHQRVEVPAQRLDDVLTEAGLAGSDIHFMTIDVEGAERNVLASIDLTVWRPWVIVVEATKPLTTEPAYAEWDGILTGGGYVFVLFDGLSRFYVAQEHYATLGAALSYPACILDVFTTPDQRRMARLVNDGEIRLEQQRELLAISTEQLITWRAAAVDRWSHGFQAATVEAQNEIDAMRQTLSWRITRPLRSVRTRVPVPGKARKGIALMRRALR